jgi:hypothetical protein
MLVTILLINYISVKAFGEVEFWLSSVKVVVMCGVIVVLIVLALGGGPTSVFHPQPEEHLTNIIHQSRSHRFSLLERPRRFRRVQALWEPWEVFGGLECNGSGVCKPPPHLC